MRPVLFALALVAPIAAMAFWFLSVQQVVTSGKMANIRVVGYDPRDLLAGHYLQYRLDLTDKDPCGQGVKGDRCICFTESNSALTLSEVVSTGSCEQQPTPCPMMLRGRCEAGRFRSDVERFYFAEAMRNELVTIPDGASVMIRTESSGRGVVVDFLVSGEPLWVYVGRVQREKRLSASALASPAATP